MAWASASRQHPAPSNQMPPPCGGLGRPSLSVPFPAPWGWALAGCGLHLQVGPYRVSFEWNYSQATSSPRCTRRPMAVATLTSASSENRDTRPRSRSFMRGCVMPHWAAASTCVHLLSFTIAAIYCINSARVRRLAACSGVSARASHTLAKVCDLLISGLS